MFLGRHVIESLIRQGRLVVEPYVDGVVSNNGLDLALGSEYCLLKKGKVFNLYSNTYEPEDFMTCYRAENVIHLRAGQRILAHTIEYIRLPEDVMGFVGIRSTYARLGLVVPFTIVDAGFEGQLTIEILGGDSDILLPVGERIVHLALATVIGAEPYRGHYTGQQGVTPSKLLRG